MNAIEQLQDIVKGELPSVQTRIHRPKARAGSWWLDAVIEGHFVRVEWSPERGFGVNAPALEEDGYGEGHDETFDSLLPAAARIVALLRARSHTVAPREVLLADLRAMAGMTQEQLAQRLGVQQAAVSRLERRDDITLSSLSRFVTALGAELEINVRTAAGELLRLGSVDPAKIHRAVCRHVESALSSGASDLATPSAIHDAMSALDELRDTVRARWSLGHTTVRLSDEAGGAIAVATPESDTIALNPHGIGHLVARHSATRDLPVSKQALWRNAIIYFAAHEYGHLIQEDVRLGGLLVGDDVADELRADAIAGWLCGRMNVDDLPAAMAEDWLDCGKELCTHPSTSQRTLAYTAGRLSAQSEAACPALTLLVLRSTDLERSRRFYTGLGLRFRAEQHGRGPKHYSCSIGDGILELYPCARETSPIRVGLRVSDPCGAIAALLADGLLSEQVELQKRGGSSPDVYLVRDPDGNVVELESNV